MFDQLNSTACSPLTDVTSERSQRCSVILFVSQDTFTRKEKPFFFTAGLPSPACMPHEMMLPGGCKIAKRKQTSPVLFALNHLHFSPLLDRFIPFFSSTLGHSPVESILLWVVVPLLKWTGREPCVQLQPSGDGSNIGSQKHLDYYELLTPFK